MIYDQWDISHICIAVPDLEEAMAHYRETLGVEWGAVLDVGEMDSTLYSKDGQSISAGLREVLTIRGQVNEAGPSLELAWSAPGSASQGVWGGVPSGEHRVHHTAYFVDDLAAETADLLDKGFTREVSLTPPGEPPQGMCYLVSPVGIRYELMATRDKPAMARWLRTGEFHFEPEAS